MTAEALSDAPVQPPPAPVVGARFLGSEPVFWRLLSRGALLLFATLGIYRFWLATDVRRFLWNNTEIAGEGLEYIGTARELLLGFLIAVALLVPLNVAFFLAAFSSGTLGQIAGTLAFAVLAALGQFAVYRARRYRLSRTVYRGIRFHQTGSAVRYAICAIFWWGMIAATLGLAYPFAQASLERYKLRNTFYGDLQGQFDGWGTRLLFRGFLLWLVVVGPFVFGLIVAVGAIDWTALGEALSAGGSDVASRIEAAGVGPALVVAVLAVSWSVLAAALLYPAFQAMVLHWWISGLRFGELTATSGLRMREIYRLYAGFVSYALLAALVFGVGSIIGLVIIGAFESMFGKGIATELLTTAMLIGTYVIVALAYSTIYQATVKVRFWKHAFDTLELSGTEVLERVKAAPTTGSPVGEGLADALNVGGI